MKITKIILGTLATGALAFVPLQSARATAELELIEGASTLIITDNGVGDLNAGVGQIGFAGVFGTFNITFAAGSTKPDIGSAINPSMDIGTFEASGSGTLTILFSDTDFGPTNGSAIALLTGSTTGGQTATYTTYGGNSNTVFDTSNLLTTIGPVSGTLTPTTVIGSLGSLTGPYSLTQEFVINGGGSSSLDARLNVPDGGLTVALLGFAFIGLEGLRRKLCA